jgi:hypothetical protein
MLAKQARIIGGSRQQLFSSKKGRGCLWKADEQTHNRVLVREVDER